MAGGYLVLVTLRSPLCVRRLTELAAGAGDIGGRRTRLALILWTNGRIGRFADKEAWSGAAGVAIRVGEGVERGDLRT